MLDTFGELLFRQGRLEEARPLLERATTALAPYPSLKAKLAVRATGYFLFGFVFLEALPTCYFFCPEFFFCQRSG